jgi:cephalosporin-C deacetylase
MQPASQRLLVVLVSGFLASFAGIVSLAASVLIEPTKVGGIYERWTVRSTGADPGRYTYVVTCDWGPVLAEGEVDLTRGPAEIEAVSEEPAMLHLDLQSVGKEGRYRAAVAVSPTELQPSVPRPSDFEAFWTVKLAELNAIPMDASVTAKPSERPGVEYATFRLRSVGGAHVYGQLAKPEGEGKFPAMLILQWASAPYPLHKAWVTDRAAEGWLALNVMPHDVPSDLPPEFYAALPQMIKNYNTVYDENRDRNYFLQMYLGNHRALDFLVGHPNWDGRILLATGTSMGGQQSLVHVPAGADTNGSTVGRRSGYPFWDGSRPRVMETAPYFDVVNFASQIQAKCLVSLGFIDDVCPPVGIWIAFNQIRGPKEVVPLVTAPHNHQATNEQQQLYFERQAVWMQALVQGREPVLR